MNKENSDALKRAKDVPIPSPGACLDDLKKRSEMILNRLHLEQKVCLLTFGSAGNRFLTRSSDTDFSLLTDGNTSPGELSVLQQALYTEFEGNPWIVSFKAWERLSVNPMDLLSVCFLCGNYSLFRKEVLNSPSVSQILNRDSLITLLAGNYLHLRFMSSVSFSDLLSRYHTTKELPVPISFGDVKYYLGGLRSIQYILMTIMLLQDRLYMTDLSLDPADCAGYFSEADIIKINKAIDLLVTLKSLCVEGNNIFHAPNLSSILAALPYSVEEITGMYRECAETVVSLCEKSDRIIQTVFTGYEGVNAAAVKAPDELEAMIDTGSANIWRTLALRTDLPPDISKKLVGAVLSRQKHSPHTMLDEIMVMFRYTGVLSEEYNDRSHVSRWLTDSVTDCLDLTLGNEKDSRSLIRMAVHRSFFRLYSEGMIPDIDIFLKEYYDRICKYFHCHSLFPAREASFAYSVCRHILHSGLFVADRLMLAEIHLTNTCNLECIWCTYRDRDRSCTLKIHDIEKLAELNPNELLIAGGGEPTLFRDGEKSFSDTVHYLRERLPGLRIRLITNGTIIPAGIWTDEIDEVSVSIDEGSREKYRLNKGADMFERVWSNIRCYLYQTAVPMLRISKIYNRENLCDTMDLARKLFELWTVLPNGGTKKKYFRFMIFAMADDRSQGAAYQSSALTKQDKAEWKNRLLLIRDETPAFYYFLENHTNLTSFYCNDPVEAIPEKCINPAGYILLGADGRMYPCFAACSAFPSVCLGSITDGTDTLSEKRSSLLSLPPLNCRVGCRPGNVFYGSICREYYDAQKRLGLPAIRVRHQVSKIVHVSYHDPDHLIGGQGWAVYNLCREQLKDCFPVYWLSPCVKGEKPGEYLYENGKLRVIKLKFSEEYVETLFSDSPENHEVRRLFGKLAVTFIEHNFKPAECVIHLHGFIELPSHAAELTGKGYRVISTFHMLLSTRRQHIISSGEPLAYLEAAERRAISSNEIITVPSEGMIEELSEKCPDYLGKLICIPNGIGCEHFDTEYDASRVIHSKIVSFGRISPEKGFDLLIKAAQIYNRTAAVPVNLLVFGNTDLTIKARKEYAEKLLSMAGDDPRIIVSATCSGITGSRKLAEIDRAYFGVIPSLYEPFGLVIPELMARRKPVIATNTAGACDIMKTRALGRNDFGFIVEPSPQSIMQAIKWMYDHPDEVVKMSRNAYERAMDYRWADIAAQFAKLYR